MSEYFDSSEDREKLIVKYGEDKINVFDLFDLCGDYKLELCYDFVYIKDKLIKFRQTNNLSIDNTETLINDIINICNEYLLPSKKEIILFNYNKTLKSSLSSLKIIDKRYPEKINDCINYVVNCINGYKEYKNNVQIVNNYLLDNKYI